MIETEISGTELPRRKTIPVVQPLPVPLLEEVACPICESTQYTVLKAATYPEPLERAQLLDIYRSSSDQKLMDQLVQCSGCELVYLNPRVASDVIMESYSSAVDPRFAAQNPLRIQTFKRVLKRWLARRGLISGHGQSILDVGCAGGAFPKAAADLGFRAMGVEPSRWLSEFGRREYGLDLREGILEAQKFPNRSFDVITLWDVIEHLLDPNRTIAEAKRILKDDGLLVINYPDVASRITRLMGWRWPFYLSVHLYYFTPKTISLFLSQHGFEVIEFKPYMQTLTLGYVLERAGEYFKIFKALAKLTHTLRISKIPFTYYIGQTLLTARKKFS